MMQPGDRVRLRPGGVSVFTVLAVDTETGRATIQAVHDTAPGMYPFDCPVADLVPDPA